MADPARPSRRLPLRFSLRLLLVAVTAFAIGFPIWYRWPYEEEEVRYAMDAAGKPDLSRPPDTRRVITWQRQWGRGLEKHGEERYYLGGTLVQTKTYWLGEKDGTWSYFGYDGKETTRLKYRQGRLVRIETKGRNGVRREIEFPDGAGTYLLLFDGVATEDRLARLVAQGAFNERRINDQLQHLTDIEFVDIPLKDGIEILMIQHEIPIVIDPHHVDREQPITEELHGLPLTIALTVMTSSRGLGCDYRYGVIWITSAEDAKDWHDPTGVVDIVPPKDSQLARSWNEPVMVEAFERPLAEVIDGMVGRLAIDVDTSQITPSKEGDPPHLVAVALKGMRFRDLLGILLYQARCRCRLMGETLVIVPPEEDP